MFFIKKYLYFIFIFLSFLNLNSISIKWINETQNKETETITIKCEYDIKEYILTEGLSATSFPLNHFTSINFEEQPYELFLKKEKNPIQVLHGKGFINFVIPEAEEQITSILFSYKEIDLNTNQISEIKTIEISPIIENIEKDIKENKNEIIDDSIIISENNYNEENILKNNEEFKDINSSEKFNEKNINENLFQKIINYLKSVDNLFLLSLIVFIIGILMSFTPCIYPMIPITISILGIKNNENKIKSIIKATMYVFGIALTFSLLGLLAVSGNLMLGGLFAKSWFLFIIILFFLYMAFGMFGFYEIYSPSLNISNSFISNPYLKSFLYGIFSGTITSPCVSPGLLSVLTIVAEKGNYIYGMFLLFCFGLGLGFPLWLIAVIFGNFFEKIPKAGSWMNKIKIIIGLIILIIAFRYSIILFPKFIVIIFYLIILGFLIKKISNNLKISIIFFLVSSSLILLLNSDFNKIIKKIFGFKYSNSDIYFKNKFSNNLKESIEKAINEEKLILIDFTADWCSLCKEIEKKHFKSSFFWNNIDESIIAVKINCNNTDSLEIKSLIEKYEIKGLPTFIILNPFDEKVIEKFGSEVLNLTTQEFSNKIINLSYSEN